MCRDSFARLSGRAGQSGDEEERAGLKDVSALKTLLLFWSSTKDNFERSFCHCSPKAMNFGEIINTSR